MTGFTRVADVIIVIHLPVYEVVPRPLHDNVPRRIVHTASYVVHPPLLGEIGVSCCVYRVTVVS